MVSFIYISVQIMSAYDAVWKIRQSDACVRSITMMEGVPFSQRKKSFSCARALRQRIPILEWGPKYSRDTALADLIAGVTLGLTLVPQSIAYASLANLPVHYGLYSSFVGTMVYVFMGTVKEVSIGPTSLMALLTVQTCRGLPIEFVVLLTFLSGVIVLIMGLLKLGFLVELISPSVTSGFTSATAVIIVAAQLKGLLGLSFAVDSVVDNFILIAKKWRQVRIADCMLSVVCCTVLLSLRKLKDLKVSEKRPKLKKALWLLSISRNAIVVCAASLFAYYTYNAEKPLVRLSGRVVPGLPSVTLPPFSVTMNNTTINFVGMVQKLGAGIVMMPLVMVLANIAIAKAFCEGGRVNASQEMVTLGMCNMAGAFVKAMPTCGAFTRSAVSHSSGVRSPAAGLYSGIITLLALNYMTQYFFFIPKACLSSVLICAVIFMVDIPIVGELWHRSKRELAVLLVTFSVSLCWTVELAVIVGVSASLGMILYDIMRPGVQLQFSKTTEGGALIARLPAIFLYINAERVAEKLTNAFIALTSTTTSINKEGTNIMVAPPSILLLDCSAICHLDYSAVQVLTRLIKKFEDRSHKIILFNASAPALEYLEKMGNIEMCSLRVHTVTEVLRIEEKCSEPLENTALLLEMSQHHSLHV